MSVRNSVDLGGRRIIKKKNDSYGGGHCRPPAESVRDRYRYRRIYPGSIHLQQSNCGWIGGSFFFFKQKTAYEIVPCDWSSDVCSSDLSQREQTVAALRRHYQSGRLEVE